MNVQDNVELSGVSIGHIPFQFGVVKGNFMCNGCALESLEGSPSVVYGNFSAQSNQLTTLLGAPKEVYGVASFAYNQLTNLEHCPQKVSDLEIRNNKLISLKGIAPIINKNLWCQHNALTSFEGPKYIGGFANFSNNCLIDLSNAPEVKDAFILKNNPLLGKHQDTQDA